MNWTDFLAELRADLQDTGSTPRWSDQMLYVYTKDGVRDYSTWFPRRVDRTRIVPVGNAYLLPADYIEDIHVEAPLDTFLERRAERPGVRYPSGNRLFYFVQGGNIYLSFPRDEIYLTYHAAHPVPPATVLDISAEGEDPVTYNFTVPDADIELIRLYVKAKIFGQMRGRQAALDRFKIGTGARDDNPVLPEVVSLMDEYYRRIAQRVRGGSITLYRPGRLK